MVSVSARLLAVASNDARLHCAQAASQRAMQLGRVHPAVLIVITNATTTNGLQN